MIKEENKLEVVSATLNWQKINFPKRTNDYSKCERDLGIVYDSYLFDLEYNTTRNITYVAGKYWFADKRQIIDYETELAVHSYMADYIIRNYLFNNELKEKFIILKNILFATIEHGPEYMNYTHMHKYQYVMEYDTDAIIDTSIIKQSLYEAWNTTPSKQQMMPYNIFVLGPNDKKAKESIYYKALVREYKTNFPRYDIDENDPIAIEKAFIDHRGLPPQYYNYKTAPYIIICTQRVVTNVNKWNSDMVRDIGLNFEQTSKENKHRATKLACIEIGMFTQTFANLCLQHGLDVSHTRCLPDEKEWWDEPEFSFLNDIPILIMSVGKGKVYRRGFYPGLTHGADHRPAFDEVVKFVGNV